MNFKQLKYICEIKKCGLNVSLAAQSLNASQPGISKQVKLLEEELGIEIFERRRNRLVALTPNGAKIVAMADVIVKEAINIKRFSREVQDENSGALVIAATETQAHYYLPPLIKRFSLDHPKVRITLRHSVSGHIVEMLRLGLADIGVTNQAVRSTRDVIGFSCYKSEKILIVPKGHELASCRRPTLHQLAQYPLITYDPAVSAGEQVTKEFEKVGLEPELAVIAISADVIKACVSQGLGIGILSNMTFMKERDTALAAIPVGHLFEPSVTSIFISRHLYLKKFTYDFIEMCSGVSRAKVQALVTGK